jgi:hypothetical protein
MRSDHECPAAASENPSPPSVSPSAVLREGVGGNCVTDRCDETPRLRERR